MKLQLRVLLMDEGSVFLNLDPFQKAIRESPENEETLQMLADAEQRGYELQKSWMKTLNKEDERTAQLTVEMSSTTTGTTNVTELSS